MSPNIKIEARKANGVPGQFLRGRGKSPKICFHLYFYIFSPICSNNCGVVFWEKFIFSFEK